jgi:hypothetical protein
VHSLNPRPAHPPAGFLFRHAFSAKNTPKIFFVKRPCRELFPKNRKKIQCQFFLDLFCFIAFWGFLSDGSSKTLQTTFCPKQIVPKNPKPIYFIDLF